MNENSVAEMLGQVVIAVPIYKEELDWNEKISLGRLMAVLGHYPIAFLVKSGLKAEYLPTGENIKRINIMEKFMKNKLGYNAMMLNPYFYRQFSRYEYVLIYQLDAIVFSDRLKYFCDLGYDYYGARWWYYVQSLSQNPLCRRLFVGNGGLTLRHVAHTIDLLENNPAKAQEYAISVNEDMAFALLAKEPTSEYRICPIKVAYEFSGELLMERSVKNNGGRLPFGAHAWQKLSSDFYRRIFKELGIELGENAAKLEHIDVDGLYNILELIFFKRMCRELNRGERVQKYLNFTPKYLLLLGSNNNVLARRVGRDFGGLPGQVHEMDFGGENYENWLENLAEKIKKAPKPVLLMTNPYDSPKVQLRYLATDLKKHGITIGEGIYSLYAEYGKYYGNLIKNKFKK